MELHLDGNCCVMSIDPQLQEDSWDELKHNGTVLCVGWRLQHKNIMKDKICNDTSQTGSVATKLLIS